jgi:hypothetical protein
MTDGVHHGVTRRDVLAKGAVVAGFAWSAPTIRSVRRLGTPGTPEPPTSTTGPMGRTIAFSGDLSGSFRPIEDAACPPTPQFVSVLFDLSGTLTNIGESIVLLDVCGVASFEEMPPFPIVGDTFSLQAPTGSLGGTIRGLFQFRDFSIDITITGGSGAFAGARGFASAGLTAAGSTVSGHISGVIELP